jgi:predicted phosphate transport protein (TIGR00153 family)
VKPLESWLKTRRKVLAISMVLEHSKATVMAMEQLDRCINFALQGKREDLARSFEILQLKEKEADLLKRKIIGEIAKGDLPVSEREDLMRLGRQTDDVIDWINETGRILVEFNLKDMPEDVKKITGDMIQVITSCVIKLDDCIEKLTNREFQDAFKAADEVERLEEQMDGLYQMARRSISGLKTGNVEIGQAILLSDFMDALETITDRCEDSCDEVRAIAVTAPLI